MKRVSVSNIAWPAPVDDEAIDLALELGFEGIEIAPSKIFPDLINGASQAARYYRTRLGERGLAIPSLQAIMYGTSQCELFVSSTTRRALRDHLASIAELAGLLGAHACVFGAPKLRDPGDLNDQQAMSIAVEFFADVAPIFSSAGTCLAFEANAVQYNCRFITRTVEAIELVKQINHPGVRVQLDTGTIFSMSESPDVVGDAAPYAAHFHASEPGLVPVGSVGSNHALIAQALGQSDYEGWISVEMATTPNWQEDIRNAAKLIATTYQT